MPQRLMRQQGTRFNETQQRISAPTTGGGVPEVALEGARFRGEKGMHHGKQSGSREPVRITLAEAKESCSKGGTPCGEQKPLCGVNQGQILPKSVILHKEEDVHFHLAREKGVTYSTKKGDPGFARSTSA